MIIAGLQKVHIGLNVNNVDQGALNHLGIEVETTAAVLAANERLKNAGLATQDEWHHGKHRL